MALVSTGGMGEAVLAYSGDGIASSSVVRDGGGVFAGRKGDGVLIAKEIRRRHEDGVKEEVRKTGRVQLLTAAEPERTGGGAGSDASNNHMHGFVRKNNSTHRGLANGSHGSLDIISKAARLANDGSATKLIGSVSSSTENEKAGDGLTSEDGGKTPRKDEEDRGKRSENGAAVGSSDHLVERAIRCLDEKVDKDALTLEALQLLRLVPEGYIPLPHQVGGHRHVDGKLGFLRKVGQDEILFKPVQPGVKGDREVQFYDNLFGEAELPSEVLPLRQLVPGYYHRETIRDRAGNLHDFLKLEDITHRYRRPCIMDVKVGKRVWDDFAEKDKIDRERKKYPAQETLGYRIIGMRVYQPSSEDYIYYDKWYGRSITEDTALEAVTNFFVCGEVNRVDVIAEIIGKLQKFLAWFRTQTSLRLFATSLLIVYEGAPSHYPGSGTVATPVDIRLVDFAHTYEAAVGTAEGETDANTLFGLENFTQCLSVILSQNQIF